MTPVTRKDFEIKSDIEVVHNPTGAVFRARASGNPEDLFENIEAHWGDGDAPRAGSDDYADRIRRLASHLLLERVHQAARSQHWGDPT